ncbi:transcriptional regulator [[Actinomadura] parvosata subsp. kistnae]|uniref:Transcriptional regulator n=2 Tax=Nonomuraea TaxID=83681 RepID=A0A1U9ZXP6_9ACTN|nr:YafY family protein [Nonomuraea sp. ATCC 55076]AQZ62718.1 transcriptional regulator [Nonomuraea sp. ATCC 55076]
MVNTSARLLQLLSLLSARQSWTCAELAAQLRITERTVRRDIARLRELGYGIESEMGPWGGYHLGPGTGIPPLILDEEEALAVAVGLRAAAFSGVSGSDQAALSALLKLRQVLPARIADRLGELDAAFTHTAFPDDGRISPALLLGLATACRRGERIRLTYRDGGGTTSTRRVDPYRLIYTGRRWYLLAYDVTRQDWRTFRTDRIVEAAATGQAAALPDPPDPARMVGTGIASRPYPMRVSIRLAVPADEARRLVPPTVGVHRPDGADATIVDIGGPDADGLARYLLSLGRPLRILHPEEVRQAFLARARQLLEDNQAP